MDAYLIITLEILPKVIIHDDLFVVGLEEIGLIPIDTPNIRTIIKIQ